LAMYNFDYKLLNNINAFNIISKDRYLSWWNKYSKSSDNNK
jgi:hypothetical protein